jgi:hypothetical protein
MQIGFRPCGLSTHKPRFEADVLAFRNSVKPLRAPIEGN